MWNLAGIPVVMTKWSPVIEKEKPPTQSIPMWVHIKHVPLSMVSWQGLSFLTSPIGSPSRLHPETAQCLNLDVAKIFVRVDLTKDLPKKMNFKIKGEDVMVEYVYPWLPTKCGMCDKWGHAIKNCPMENEAKKRENNLVIEEGEIKGESSHKEEGEKEEVQQKKGGEEGIISIEEAAEVVIKDGRMGNTEENITEEGQDREWLEVSPGKTSRSSNKKGLQFGQVSILTKSRFDVLTPEEGKSDVNEEIIEVEQSDEITQEEDVLTPEKEKAVVNEEIIEVEIATQITQDDEVVTPEEEKAVVNDENMEDEQFETMQEEVLTRKMLPRESKVNHRYLRDKPSQKIQDADPSHLNKKKSRRQ